MHAEHNLILVAITYTMDTRTYCTHTGLLIIDYTVHKGLLNIDYTVHTGLLNIDYTVKYCEIKS